MPTIPTLGNTLRRGPLSPVENTGDHPRDHPKTASLNAEPPLPTSIPNSATHPKLRRRMISEADSRPPIFSVGGKSRLDPFSRFRKDAYDYLR